MSKYSDIIEASYGFIKPDGTIDDEDKDNILTLLDADWQDEPIKSKLLIWFDYDDGSFLGTGDGRNSWIRGYNSKWIPNHGIDVDLPYHKQNAQNGTILDNVCCRNFSYNDIITYSSITSRTRNSSRAARMYFTSHRLTQTIAMMVGDFCTVAKKMTKGIIIGRFCFKGVGDLMTIKPVEYC